MAEIYNADSLQPAAIVAYLDRYIVGQTEAKRAVAVALRNRVRRRRLPEELAAEITPKNILMVGPTGVGKTEIARRLASLVQAPFVKVEATKFTEVGYVGRDVESMVRDLVEAAVRMVKERMAAEKTDSAASAARERMIDYLVPVKRSGEGGGIPTFMSYLKGVEADEPSQGPEMKDSTRDKMRRLLEEGKLDDREVEIEVQETPPATGMDQSAMGVNIGEMLGSFMPKRTKRRRVKVKDGLRILQAEEAEKLIDTDRAHQEAIKSAQDEGIIFIDEIDKVVASENRGGADVSREGVQRDLLPIVEGCTVPTKYGPVKTDHMLFIAAGAFQSVKPSDLVPELQGRLPLRVELSALRKEDLSKILTEPRHNLLDQYKALLSTEGVELCFTADGIDRLAELAERTNRESENIGARRLHTMLERVLEDVSFSASDYAGQTVTIDRAAVDKKLADIAANVDLRRYLL
ncbi:MULTISPECIES: ATP-dependent protease ATPase subunit HslU [Jonquetella]|uniref:ATP-dependent protease ATPase subunit HslU n=1 Tax=Jonquetella anthropi DSM 22815 TaxID=885272 RepID=H0UKL3_9BACT|nr:MULTISPECIES: ATP-dependent protease ATPase subunit HslU [Jonquetella]EEX48414.1 ATP-dependent protease HslVU, ATPase subunit [Jonquetella anthropi E3_33 E1]EHM13222.1 ATP-dependent protease HslVU, ATPase subunit [Jonquetella anthropi DSM 22815]ERL23716.1 ATP-dependent protease HslVU, ATPase subunit [Jonquetella sp. BV3C21]